jgi:hypothetical protein
MLKKAMKILLSAIFLMKTIGRKSHNPGSRHLCGKELRDAMKVSPKIIADVETASEAVLEARTGIEIEVEVRIGTGKESGTGTRKEIEGGKGTRIESGKATSIEGGKGIRIEEGTTKAIEIGTMIEVINRTDTFVEVGVRVAALVASSFLFPLVYLL